MIKNTNNDAHCIAGVTKQEKLYYLPPIPYPPSSLAKVCSRMRLGDLN